MLPYAPEILRIQKPCRIIHLLNLLVEHLFADYLLVGEIPHHALNYQ